MFADYMPLVASGVGATLQELIYWYDSRSKLETDEYQRMMHSLSYWVITFLMIVLSAIGCCIWYSGQAASGRDYLITGAGFPLLLKKAVSALTSNQNLKLGTRRPIAAYFYSA